MNCISTSCSYFSPSPPKLEATPTSLTLVGRGKLKTAWYSSERPSRTEEVTTSRTRRSVHFFRGFLKKWVCARQWGRRGSLRQGREGKWLGWRMLLLWISGLVREWARESQGCKNMRRRVISWLLADLYMSFEAFSDAEFEWVILALTSFCF